ncbi:MAG: MerR family transcriptional regulator [Clostridia bacterium]|nr:MerR family transcriptional regulator [Clostridia bacterium]
MRMKRIGEVAALAGISVRTLHYYDQIGLLSPRTSQAGYRLYSDDDLERLWQILFFSELAFPLEQIKAMMASPSYDRNEALKSHRLLLSEKKKRLEGLITTIDDILEKGFEAKMLKTFDMNSIEEHKKKYAGEAAEKYGDAYKQSQAKTARYSKEQWQQVMEEAQEIFDGLAECMDMGADCAQAQAMIGRWRAYISERYFDCKPEILKGLGQLYVSDERFTKNIDKTKPGLASFIKQAIDIYCGRAENHS